MGLANVLKFFRRDKSGLAAIEFAIFGGTLAVALLNVADTAVYLYERMEVENASDLAVMAGLKTCDTNHLPATVNCSGLNTAVTTAAQSTSLGAHVSIVGGGPTEGYYCVNLSNALQYVSDVNNKPLDCLAAGTPLLSPGDYINVQVTYPYAPIFGQISIGSLFSTPITKTALMRVG